MGLLAGRWAAVGLKHAAPFLWGSVSGGQLAGDDDDDDLEKP